jgi:hypothetical protein
MSVFISCTFVLLYVHVSTKLKFLCEFWTSRSLRNESSNKRFLCVVWHGPVVPQSTIDGPEVLGDTAKGKFTNIQQAGLPDGHPL